MEKLMYVNLMCVSPDCPRNSVFQERTYLHLFRCKAGLQHVSFWDTKHTED